MAQLGTAYVQIVPSAQGISGKITKAISPEASAAGNMAGTKIAGGMKAKLSKISGGLFKAGAIATAVSVPIIAGIKKSLEAYQVQSAAETKLTEIYKTRMGASKRAANETIKLAGALQKEGIIGDEVALSGSQQLATFAKYPSTINTLMPAMENLLAQQKGVNATAEDATNIGNLMGKVLQGQTGALKRVGISFTEAQEKVLKYGNEEQRAAMLSKVITNNVGNMNKAMLKTPEGKIQQMKNAMGDLAEKVGATLAPVLAKLAQWISSNLIPKVQKFFAYMDKHPAIRKVALALTALAVAIGPVLIALSGIIKLMSGVGSVFKIVASGPIAWIIAAVAALVVGFMYLWKKSKGFREFWIKLWNGIKTVASTVVNAIVKFFKTAWDVIKKVWSAVVGFFRGIWNGIKAVFSAVVWYYKTIFSAAVAAIKFVWNKIVTFFTTIWNGIKKVFSAVGNFFKSKFTAAWRAVKAAFKAAGRFFKSVWDKIKAPFKAVADWFRRKFKAAWEAIKSVFSGVVDFFGGIWDTIKEAFKNIGTKIGEWIGGGFKAVVNWVLEKLEWAINKALKVLKSIAGAFAGVGIDIKIPEVKLPRLAKGGILAKGQIGLLEGDGAEAVVPLEKNTEWINRVADQFNGVSGNSKSVVINNNIRVDGAESPEQYASRLARQIRLQLRTV